MMELAKNLLVLLVFAVLSSTVMQGRAVPLKPSRLCGFKLPKTLAIVCQHNYNRPSWDLASVDYEASYQRKLMKRSTDQGIVEECCLKICSRQQLMAYCGNINDYQYDELSSEHRVEDRSAESPRELVMTQTEAMTEKSTTTTTTDRGEVGARRNAHAGGTGDAKRGGRRRRRCRCRRRRRARLHRGSAGAGTSLRVRPLCPLRRRQRCGAPH